MASRTDQRSALVWAGQKNFYSRYRDFWVLGAGDPGSPPETLSFDQWKQQWTAAGEVDPLSETIPFARSWSERPLWELNPRDVELAGDATTNRAIGGSTSGSNAGVNLRTLTELGIGLSVSSQATSRDATLK